MAPARTRAAARGRILLTGRTDNFLNGRPDLDDTIRCLTASAEVDADVLDAPVCRAWKPSVLPREPSRQSRSMR